MRQAPAFKPLKKARLYEEVATQIKQAIYDGTLRPGDRLPPERELCRMFDVGRPTIREALRTLSVMGLLEIHRGSKGSVIREADTTQYIEAIREQVAWLIRGDEKTFKELWEVRKYIEWGISHAVAERASDTELRKLEKLLGKMEDCVDDIESYFSLAVEFHQQLALTSKNKIFFLIWEMFHDILLKGYLPRLGDIFPDGAGKLLEANKVLLEAIKSREPKAIDKAMALHAAEEDFFSPPNSSSTPKGAMRAPRSRKTIKRAQ